MQDVVKSRIVANSSRFIVGRFRSPQGRFMNAILVGIVGVDNADSTLIIFIGLYNSYLDRALW